MYFVFVIATTVVLPIGIGVFDYQFNAAFADYAGGSMSPTDIFYFLAKWYVFWAGGVRLFASGLRQTFGPRLRQKQPVEVDRDPSERAAQRLGFVKLLIGGLCIATEFVFSVPFNSSIATLPAGVVAAGAFYGLSGLHHVRMPRRNARQTLAMVTDLLVFAVLAVVFALIATGVVPV